MLSVKQITQITEHIERHIGTPANVLHPLIPEDLHIDVHIVSPTSERPWQTLITSGMSEFAMPAPPEMRDYRHAELMICLPPEWPIAGDEGEVESAAWPLFWLQLLAKTPYEHQLWFGPDHTIPNGDPPEPFAEGTDLCCMMLRLPRLAPPEFRMLTSGRKSVHFLGLVPIYKQEMDLALKQGHGVLAARLDQAGVTELINPSRPSVA